MSEILSGLDAGERVLADAASPIADGTRVRFTEQVLPIAGGAGNPDTRNELPVNFN
jgi:HlyD family secretion protein